MVTGDCALFDGLIVGQMIRSMQQPTITRTRRKEMVSVAIFPFGVN
jgi:hypothetical protein